METNVYDLCIVGGGLSGLALAAFLGHSRPELRLLVMERERQAGGLLESFSQDGYLAERGPHGFLDNCAASRELICLAGLEAEAIYAPLSRFGRYLCLDGKLQLIPQTFGKVLKAPLMPFRDKVRVLGDLWRPYLAGEPSVADWVAYRFGKALLPFADAAMTGTYAGDIERLTIDGVMPGIRELERQHGSVIRGLLRRMWECRCNDKRDHQRTETKKMPSMTNFRDGMAMLPQVLAAILSARGQLRLKSPVHALAYNKEGWRVESTSGAIICRDLVLALPIWASLSLLRPLCDELPPPAVEVPEAHMATVLLGFDQRAKIPFGFGYLAPEQEKRFALGALFSSHMFLDRAPAGRQLLEVPVGGRRHPERLDLSDEALIARTCQDLQGLIPLPEPCFSAVLRPSSGIPQFEAGYTRLRAWREQIQGQLSGLHLCGFGWNGIGVNDMVQEAARVAQLIGKRELKTDWQSELKAVYF